jgi:hypothetical protein
MQRTGTMQHVVTILIQGEATAMYEDIVASQLPALDTRWSKLCRHKQNIAICMLVWTTTNKAEARHGHSVYLVLSNHCHWEASCQCHRCRHQQLSLP